MAKEGSVAPKERVNIVYKPATGDQQEEKELPFKTLVVGDFTLRPDDTPVEDREVISVDKNNFDDVLKGQDLKLDMSVQNKLSGSDDPDEKLAVSLKVESMKDFDPDNIVQQVPELQKLMELREALKALKGPMGNVPAFRKKVQELVDDPGARERIIKELELDEAEAGGDAGGDADAGEEKPRE